MLIPGALAPKLVTRAMIREMKDGAVLCDVAIDQGGCAETSRPTTHDDPVYVVDGVTHYCVANMPGAVPITSTKALTNVTLPYVEAIAEHGLAGAVARDPALARGVNVLPGKVTYEAVAEAHGLDYVPLEDVLPGAATPRSRLLLLLRRRLRPAPRRRDLDDRQRHGGGKPHHEGDVERQPEQPEDRVHVRRKIAPCRARA